MRYSLLLLALATPLAAQEQQAADPSRAAVAAARSSWISAHNYIVRSAEQMSEANFAFKPVATVRSFGQIVAHVADDETGWCAQILGEPLKQTQYEKTLTSKIEIMKAIQDAGAYCEKAYAITDAEAAGVTTIWGGQIGRASCRG